MSDHIFRRELAILTENRTLLERPRIKGIFAEALQKSLIIVSAGTGYGKTWAVYSFLQNYDADTLWLQLSERDNLGARFWEHFTNTILLRDKNLAERLSMLGFPETRDQFEKYLSTIEDNLLFKEKRVIVFDDFHLIEENSVLRFVERSINSPFPNVAMILISQTDPNINMVRLLSQGMVFHVNEDDLRLTEGEIAGYFRLMGIPLSPQSIAGIYSDTAGWMLAVNLISLSLKKSPDQVQDARIAMKLNIFKMIENEVFLVSSERMRRFLIQLSLIEHLSRDLVSILAGGDKTLIEELKKITSFVRIDTFSHVYLIHRLFLDYLRQKQDFLTAEEKKDIYLKAARWCDENEYKMDAVSYYDKAGEYKAIVELVYHLPIRFPYDQAKFILDVYNKAPASALEDIALYHREYPNLLMSLNRYAEALADIEKRIEKYSALPCSDFNNRVLCGTYMALAIARYLMAPHTDRYDFEEPLEKSTYYYQSNPSSPYLESGSITSVSLSALVSKVGTTRSGAMEEYIDALTRSIPHMSHMMGGCMFGLDDLARGELQFYKGDLKNSMKFLRQALYKAEEKNQYEVRNRALFYLLRIAVAQGDFKGVQRIFKNLSAQLEMKEYPTRFITYDIVSSWYHFVLNQPNLVVHWILSDDFGKGSIGTFKEDFGNFVKAKFYYSDKRYHELLSFIESKPVFGEVLFGKLEIKLLTAACQYHIKNRDESRVALREAYDLALSNNLTMPFIEMGNDMRTLTRAAMREKDCGIPIQWLELINRKSATYAKQLLLVISEYKKANNIGDDVRLSTREMEVLQDLYEGLSRSEIAANRDLSITTVKMLLNTVYAKLGANSLADVIRISIKRNLVS
ncbi:MAG: LuxR C-terminal-related transcriptional regulator [Synergistaceae bacterium]|jgi:LuxR family maltose regulon positive regulatory protein|nr:LuxR C-terminal-related transcriptional regulator [Synergistaceae bacterium]